MGIFHRQDDISLPAPASIVDIEDRVKKSKKGAPAFAGDVAREPRQTKNPSHVGTRELQKAPLTAEIDQSVGGNKISKGKKLKDGPHKKAWEKTNMKKQTQEVNRPSPRAIKRGK